jgi:hypothetical protein
MPDFAPCASYRYGSTNSTQLRHRRDLRGSLGFVPGKGYLRLTRDALSTSPGQAADVLQGHSVNGADVWATADGVSYNQVAQHLVFPDLQRIDVR